jgi:hypothetical protein
MDKKLTDLPEKLIAPVNAWVHLVDIDDVTDSPQGTDFKIKKTNLLPNSNTTTFGTWTLKKKAFGNTGTGIEFNDLCEGQIDNETYCLLGRYKNYTSDNNKNNPLNYEILSTSGLISQ